MRRETLAERPKGRANNPDSKVSRSKGYSERKSFTCPRTSSETSMVDFMEEEHDRLG